MQVSYTFNLNSHSTIVRNNTTQSHIMKSKLGLVHYRVSYEPKLKLKVTAVNEDNGVVGNLWWSTDDDGCFVVESLR